MSTQRQADFYRVSRRLLKLLFVSSDTFPPTRVDVSVLFAGELSGRGHIIDWVLQSEDKCHRPYQTNYGGGIVWVGATDLGTSRLRRLWKHVLGVWNDLRVLPLLQRNEYDLVLVKDKFIAGIVALAAARIRRVRFVYWLSYPFPEASLHEARTGVARYPWLYWIRGTVFRLLLYRILLPAADHVFVQSEQMLSDVAREGIRTSKMTAVPMGVSGDMVQQLTPTARSLIPVGTPAVIYLGTMIKTRRLEFLVRVIELVRRSVPDALLYFVGSGEDPSDKEVLVCEAQLRNVLPAVVFTGQLPRPEALAYVIEGNVCVSPFFPTPILNSTSPTKLVEYMALGKPVVANDHPEQRLVIEESGAGYCVPYEEGPFAEAVVSLLRDPSAAQRMGLKGRQYVERVRTYSAIADSVESKLGEVVACVADNRRFT